MEVASVFIANQPTRFAAYMALQRQLMQIHRAKGGTDEVWCVRLAPVFRKRYSWILEENC